MSDQKKHSSREETSWGPKLFYSVLIGVLIFFWWMVIYSHGVAPAH